MIEGVYRFIIDGEVIAEQKNALTSAGRSIAIKSLLGIVPNFAGVISYGIGNKQNTLDTTTNLITNNCMQFEIGRTPVIGSSLDVSSNTDVLIYSGVIDSIFQYQIHEVGLFPGGNNNTNSDVIGEVIFDFDRLDLFTKVGTASGAFLTDAIEARIGTQLLSIPPIDGTNSYLSYPTTNNSLSSIDFYTTLDTFRLAGMKLNQTSSSVNFRFYTDDTNYYEYIFVTPTASGYFIKELEKGSAGITGNPSWTNITSARIWVNSASSIYLDGLKIDYGSYYLDTFSGLISRAVLASPVRKPAGIPMTIEYSLSIGFNQI